MRRQFDTAYRQYRVKEVQRDDTVAWNDGLKSEFPAVKMLGKTEQQSYTGKNLLDVVNAARIFGSAYDSKYPVKYENGVLWNGGKAGITAGANLVLPVVPGRYTITFHVAFPYENQNVRVIAAEGYSEEMVVQNLKILAWVGSKAAEGERVSATVTVPEGYHYLGFSMQASEFHLFGITDVMICTESADVAYEPYTGGIPSPNPYYPQEVKANNPTVRSLGRNLFPKIANATYNGVTLQFLDDGGYRLDGTCTAAVNLSIQGLLPEGTYTLSCDYEGVLPSSGNARAQVYSMQSGEGGAVANSEANNAVKTFRVANTGRFEFRIILDSGFAYENVKLYPMLVRGEFTAETMPEFVLYFDGGEAAAPNLMCAVDGSCQSTYDPQTGEFVNWWMDKITLNGSEKWRAATAPDEGKWGFSVEGIFPEKLLRNACWSNQTAPQAKWQTHNGTPELWCGMGNGTLYAFNFGFYDETLHDKGASNWKAHLAEHPLEVWVARNEPEVTNIGPQRLTCPTGYGQIVQVAGDIPDCPLEVQYLAHGGNVG